MNRKAARRTVLAAGAALPALTIVPSSVLAQGANKKKARKKKEKLPPSERLNLGFVGIGGRGAGNLRRCACTRASGGR